MSRFTAPFLGMMLALAASGHGQSSHGQSSSPNRQLPSTGAEPVVAEVRLLRQAVDRQLAVLVRSQILGTQLLAQSQRVARAQTAVDRATDALDAAEWQQTLAREAVANMERAWASSADAPQRSGLEQQLAGLRASLSAQDRNAARLTRRRQQAEQDLQAEQRVYALQETALAAFGQQLQ